MFRLSVPALIALFLSAPTALAGTPAEDLSPGEGAPRSVPSAPDDAPQSIVYGSLSIGFEATAALMDSWGQFCTGTLIAPRVVLTAAHCLEGAEIDSVYFGLHPGFVGLDVPVEGVRIHEDYDARALTNASDLGIVYLRQDVPLTPVGVDRSDAWDLIGTEIVYVGFGETEGTGGEGWKKEATATVVDIDGDVLVVKPEDGSACYGDSGGPLYRRLGDGSWTVSGVVSFGYTNDCMDLGGNTRTDVYAAWIDEALRLGPDDGAPVADGGWDTDAWDTDAWDTGAWDTGGWEEPWGVGCASAPMHVSWLALLLLAPLARRRTR